MNLAGIPTSPGRHPRRTSPFGRWRRGLVTMAILLLDRWLQPPLPPPPPSLPTTLSTLPTSFVHSACHRYDEPIAHSEKIFNHASRTRPVTVVVVEEKEGKRKNRIAPSRPPSPLPMGTKVDGGGGRTAPFHCSPSSVYLLLPQVRWNNKMPRITYSKSMAPYLRRTNRSGWDLPPSTSDSDPRVCSPGRRVDESYGRGNFRGRHFKQPHCRYQLILSSWMSLLFLRHVLRFRGISTFFLKLKGCQLRRAKAEQGSYLRIQFIRKVKI